MAVQDGGGQICFCQIFNISRKQFCGILFSAIFTDSKLCGSIFSNIPMFSHLQATLLSSSFSRVLIAQACLILKMHAITVTVHIINYTNLL